MRGRYFPPGLALALFAIAPAAHGQAARDDLPPMRFEVTPFVGYRGGGDFDFDSPAMDADLRGHVSWAIAFNVRIDELQRYELFYSHQETSLDADEPLDGEGMTVQYLHFGGTLVTVENTWAKPYIAGGIGLTNLEPDSPGSSDDTRFSLSFATGVRFPLQPRFDVRVEARAYLTFLSSDSSIFCGAGSQGGVCALRGSGTTFFQYDLLAGATWRF